jgi:assimilatory nitrate reductase catalytic subunit
MFGERFGHADGLARFHAAQQRPPAEEPDDAYPFYLITGRVMNHYQSGTQTRRIKELNEAVPHAFVEIHPALARRYGIAENDPVQLSTRRGTATFRARLTTTIRLDTLFVPFHWGGDACVNRLTNPALDPTSRMPEFKVCAVAITKL